MDIFSYKLGEKNGSRSGDSTWERGTGENSVQTKGSECTASGDYSVAEGLKSKTGDEIASSETIPVEDQVNTTLGPSHSEGFGTLAKPMGSHAEGYKSQAIGFASHAEGNSTYSKGINSHAEGVMSETMPPTGSGAIDGWRDGYASHAEGHLTTAGGRASHTEGNNTVTNNPSEHAEGQYNMSHHAEGSSYGNSGNTQHSVGIGSNLDNRKNAWEVMQNGDAYLIGIGGYNGTNPGQASTVQEALATKEDKVTVVEQTAPTAITLADNTEYELTEVANLTFTFPAGRFISTIHLTTTATGFQTVAFPATEKHVGKFPDIQASQEWIISVQNGIIVAAEVTSNDTVA